MGSLAVLILSHLACSELGQLASFASTFAVLSKSDAQQASRLTGAMSGR